MWMAGKAARATADPKAAPWPRPRPLPLLQYEQTVSATEQRQQRGQLEEAAKRRKVSNLLGGSFAYHEKVKEAGFPYGFKNIEEYARWPHWLVEQALKGPLATARKRRLEALFSPGVAMHTDCTGRMSIETVFRMMGVSLEHAGLTMMPDWFAPWRGCDIDTTCRDMMLKAAVPHAPAHVFPSLECRLNDRHLYRWRNLHPGLAASPEERAAKHTRMQDYLKANSDDIFGRDKMAPCLKHGRNCFLSFRDPPGVPPGERPLTFAIAGVPCTPWSSYGLQSGMAHAAIPAILLWLQDMACSNFDVIGIEESDRFPGKMFSDAMPEQYVVKSCVFGPQDRSRIVQLHSCVHHVRSLQSPGKQSGRHPARQAASQAGRQAGRQVGAGRGR